MVYGRLKEKTEEFATYQVGTTVDDMTGLVTFFRDGREPILNKQAERSPISLLHIARLYWKYKGRFLDGDHPGMIAHPGEYAYKCGDETIAYERG